MCGSRTWTDGDLVYRFLEGVPSVDCVIEGGARGADRLSKEAANKLCIKVEEYKPDWKQYGKRAGILRNTEMLEQGKPDLVIAFTDDLDNSKGTRHMVSISRDAKVPTIVIGHD